MFETLCKFKSSQQRDCYSSSAVLEKFIRWHSLRNKWNSQGKFMKFGCSENHVCASHKTPVIFYSITNRVRWRSSFLDYTVRYINTKYWFSAGLFACNNKSEKRCKEIHNIVVSHLFTPTLLRVFPVQCETLNESCLRSQTTLKEENCTFEWQWIWHADANPVEPGLTIP